jgi:hypothetical protein
LNVQETWDAYQTGIDFKTAIGLYETVAKNERFFAGDQWSGVSAPDLPKPVINFIKRVCQQKVAQVSANPVRVCFSAPDFPAEPTPRARELNGAATDSDAQLLNAVFDADWDRLKMDCLNLDGLLDACVSGDYILYNYWDAGASTGQAAAGLIRAETLDNVNYYPADPNRRDVQGQPWIILARREPAEDVAAQARAQGMPQSEAELIAQDGDTWHQSGDMARLEPSRPGRCVTLLLLRRDPASGRIVAQKSTRSALVRPEWDTGLTRYPLAVMNWENRKNCCHGQAEVTGLVPVQRYVNQIYAMGMLYTMQCAFPKPVFNQGMVQAWSTAIGAAVPVSGDIAEAVRYLSPPDLPGGALSLPEKLMESTLRLAGVSDLEIGSVNPTNMSAIELARQLSSAPIASIQTRLYGMLEDFARNWLDMLMACGTVPRWVQLRGGRAVVIDAAALRRRFWTVKIDAGPATMWSEINAVSTLGSLYTAGVIDARQYVERLPDGYLPMRQKLLASLGAKENADVSGSDTGGEKKNGAARGESPFK